MWLLLSIVYLACFLWCSVIYRHMWYCLYEMSKMWVKIIFSLPLTFISVDTWLEALGPIDEFKLDIYEVIVQQLVDSFHYITQLYLLRMYLDLYIKVCVNLVHVMCCYVLSDYAIDVFVFIRLIFSLPPLLTLLPLIKGVLYMGFPSRFCCFKGGLVLHDSSLLLFS